MTCNLYTIILVISLDSVLKHFFSLFLATLLSSFLSFSCQVTSLVTERSGFSCFRAILLSSCQIVTVPSLSQFCKLQCLPHRILVFFYVVHVSNIGSLGYMIVFLPFLASSCTFTSKSSVDFSIPFFSNISFSGYLT